MPRPLPSRRLSRLSLRGEGAGGSSRDRRRLRRIRDLSGYPDLHQPEPRRRVRIRGRWGVWQVLDLDTYEGYAAFNGGSCDFPPVPGEEPDAIDAVDAAEAANIARHDALLGSDPDRVRCGLAREFGDLWADFEGIPGDN